MLFIDSFVYIQRMKIFCYFLTLLILSGCITPEKRIKNIGSPEAGERMRAVLAGEFDSILDAYDIKYGIQRDDSIFIRQDDLNHVAKMAYCPKARDEVGFFSYSAKAYIDANESKVKIKINRPDCAVDKLFVQVYLDAKIEENKVRNAQRVRREIDAEAVNPRGVYKLGCEAYQKHVRGISDVPTIEGAVKMYPKINSQYVRKLFRTGWDDAKFYGVRFVDCEYLSAINIR